MSADLIFVGGTVHTVDRGNSIAEAVAVEGDRIVAVGTDDEVRRRKGARTRVVELRGRSLLPGFVDAHCHLASLGMAMVSIDCKAPGMQSIEALKKAVYEEAQRLPPGKWIRGRGYDQSRLDERRHPNRFDWDQVAPYHPVIFTRTCGHIASVSSQALKLADIHDTTPDPPGGKYDRDGGRNLGVAYETAQTPLQFAAMPTPEEYREALVRADQAYIGSGCTSVHDAGGLIGLPAFAACQDVFETSRMRLRVYAFATVNSRQHPAMGVLSAGVRTGLGDARLRLGAFKVMTDGSSSGPTAATREPYTCSRADSGILYWSQEDLDDLLGTAHRRGFQCTVHAVGDKAIDQTLTALERAQQAHPRLRLRHRIEHCGICPPDLQERVAAQGIVPAMQPAFFWEFGDGYIRNYGQHRADVMFPARSMLARGVRVAGSSDAPVTHYAPLFGIEQALARRTSDGAVCGPGERVDLTAAIRMHTVNGAYASFEDGVKGSLEPGKLADLCVLSEDIARVPALTLRDLPVAMTVLGGEVVFEG
ncbi:MAG: amidohydrolase [Candidatus Rokubacteria bacterium]|nr:amidohydrolase [Candidatus Rokubacteria bacterium]